MQEMVKNIVTFIHSFRVLMKNVDFLALLCGVLDRTA
jgi:hypothetical protein